MAVADQPIPTPRNRLLAALPAAELVRLWPRLERVELEFRKTLYAPEQPIGSVYFPETGYCCRLAPMEDGDSAEVGLIGPDGMTGVSLLLGADRENFEMLVQVPGTAMRMGAAGFAKALEDIPSLRPLLHRYVLVHFEQVARTGACNGRHDINQRLARWLLMSHDRVEDDEFPMTHEFMGMMLGVRRAGVTVAAGALQKAGLISYAKGRIVVTDRPGLEAAACECYGMAQHAHDSLIGPSAGAGSPYRR